jgi:hypothetical protein
VRKVEKLIKIAVFGFVGWIVGEVAEDALESFGVPKEAAIVAGGVIGAMV